MTKQDTLPPLDERAEFEEWCVAELNYGYDFAKDEKGDYTHDATETAWYAWEARAARAALAAQAPQPLDSIEQYRLQMAGISTAAIGYWKEGDSIHPDYDTVALRDVAKLYAKYDELYKKLNPQPQPEQQAPQPPAGFALVPLRMSQDMRDVTDSEGWTWEDLLAAAGAVTEEEYTAISAAPQQAQEVAGSYQAGWDACMSLWADHMKRMNAALNAPMKLGYANHAAELHARMTQELAAAPQAAPAPQTEPKNLPPASPDTKGRCNDERACKNCYSGQGKCLNQQAAPEPQALTDAKKLDAEPLAPIQLDAAAKKLAELFDYPWAHMPAKGRQTMRNNVIEVLQAIDAARAASAGGEG